MHQRTFRSGSGNTTGRHGLADVLGHLDNLLLIYAELTSRSSNPLVQFRSTLQGRLRVLSDGIHCLHRLTELSLTFADLLDAVLNRDPGLRISNKLSGAQISSRRNTNRLDSANCCRTRPLRALLDPPHTARSILGCTIHVLLKSPNARNEVERQHTKGARGHLAFLRTIKNRPKAACIGIFYFFR